jgi:FKBP-type peptidyl-prolyl cis-trans isomerase (trigger factor)
MEMQGIEECNITKVGDFANLKHSIAATEVTDEEIAAAIQTELESYEDLVPITERTTVEDGDFVTIESTVYCDGEVVNFSKSEVLKVGAGYFNEELESALIGARKDKKFTTVITVPEDDANKKLFRYFQRQHRHESLLY